MCCLARFLSLNALGEGYTAALALNKAYEAENDGENTYCLEEIIEACYIERVAIDYQKFSLRTLLCARRVAKLALNQYSYSSLRESNYYHTDPGRHTEAYESDSRDS